MHTVGSGASASVQAIISRGAPAKLCAPGTFAVRSRRTASPLSSGSLSGRTARPQHKSTARRISCVVNSKPQKVTAEELEVALADREVPLIVDFYATWCGPCVLLSKELEKVADDLGESIRILKVDTDENPALSTQLQIQGLPTMVFVGTDASKPALRTEGLLPAETIKQIVADELS